MAKAEPKCPSCGVEGLDKIDFAWSNQRQPPQGQGAAYFKVVYCGDCGHVYGVLNETVKLET